MTTEAIILAGGLGTRLRDTVPDLPKCMAPVNNQPFLLYVIRHLLSQGVTRFIFSLGYKHEVIEEFLNKHTNMKASMIGLCLLIATALSSYGQDSVTKTNSNQNKR